MSSNFVFVTYTGDEPIVVSLESDAMYEFQPGKNPVRVHRVDADHLRELPGFEISEDETSDGMPSDHAAP